MILRARVVVPMDATPIENGAVAIKETQIIDVGRFDEVKARHGNQVIDLGEVALLPGLINAHCHLDYTCLRGKIPPLKSFADWIRAINAEKGRLSAQDYLRSIKAGFSEARKFGTTSIANLTALPELIAEIQAPLRTWWFAELIDVRNSERAREIVDAAVEALKVAENWGIAPHAPFTASADLYRYAIELAEPKNALLTTHLGESGEEMAMFHEGRGGLYDFMKEIGRDMRDCGNSTPLMHFLKNVNPRDGWVMVHLNELAESDFNWFRTSKRKFNVVHCPRSHAYFRHSPFQFQKLCALGFNICLGTDSLASNDNLSLFAEMRQFQQNEPGVSPEEILSMLTLNGALALGKPHMLGRLRAGHLADMIAVPFSGARKSLFEQILAFDHAVSLTIVNGEFVNDPGTTASGLLSHI